MLNAGQVAHDRGDHLGDGAVDGAVVDIDGQPDLHVTSAGVVLETELQDLVNLIATETGDPWKLTLNNSDGGRRVTEMSHIQSSRTITHDVTWTYNPAFVLAVSGLFAGVVGLFAPRAVLKMQGVIGRRISRFWLRQLGGQCMMFGTRVFGASLATWCFIDLTRQLLALGQRLPLVATVLMSLSLGVVLSVYRTMQTEWVGHFVRAVGRSTVGRAQLFFSVVAPGTTLPSWGNLPETPPQYCSLTSTRRPSDTSGWSLKTVPLFDEGDPDTVNSRQGPVSFSPDRFRMQFFTIGEGQLISIRVGGDVSLVTQSRNRENEDDVGTDSSMSLHALSTDDTGRSGQPHPERATPLSRVDLQTEAYEPLARLVHELITGEMQSDNPGPDGALFGGRSLSVCCERTDIRTTDDSQVTEIRLDNVTCVLAGNPTDASCLSRATFHDDVPLRASDLSAPPR